MHVCACICACTMSYACVCGDQRLMSGSSSIILSILSFWDRFLVNLDLSDSTSDSSPSLRHLQNTCLAWMKTWIQSAAPHKPSLKATPPAEQHPLLSIHPLVFWSMGCEPYHLLMWLLGAQLCSQHLEHCLKRKTGLVWHCAPVITVSRRLRQGDHSKPLVTFQLFR